MRATASNRNRMVIARICRTSRVRTSFSLMLVWFPVDDIVKKHVSRVWNMQRWVLQIASIADWETIWWCCFCSQSCATSSTFSVSCSCSTRFKFDLILICCYKIIFGLVNVDIDDFLSWQQLRLLLNFINALVRALSGQHFSVRELWIVGTNFPIIRIFALYG